MTASAIYEGTVRHRRRQPRPHAFTYRVFLMYLDLGELDRVFAGRWLWSTRRTALARFRREDHLGDPRVPLDDAVRELVEARTGRRPAGPVRLLTHLRYFGYVMNPVSFYYCFGAGGTELDAIVAEVNNTPWGERHCYVLPAAPGTGPQTFAFEKAFHVSPFMPMALDYRWHFTRPGPGLCVHMRNLEDGVELFDATLVLERRPITGASLARVLLTYPLMTAQVICSIYYEALRLWLKRVPHYEKRRERQKTEG